MDNQSSKTIYLIRHGESVDNRKPIFQTEVSQLTKEGRKQCKEIALYLKKSGITVDKTVSSKLLRAVESTQIINSILGGDVNFLDILRERKTPSSIEGKAYSDNEASVFWSQWNNNFYKNLPTEDAETSEEIIKRAKDFLNYAQTDPSKSMLVVTHGYFLRVILAVVLLDSELDGPLLNSIQSKLMTNNAGITTLKYDTDFQGHTSWRLISYNSKLPTEVA